jgi:hypothetical protein
MTPTFLETEQKALEINLDPRVYGTFAEIGAGQEVARYFFKAGGSSGTIAKTMSAYDKTYSDAIYGIEASGRYVCENRLYKMLDHEYGLLMDRLRNEREDTLFFAYANTVAAINYQRTIKGNGWMGLRFQHQADLPPNDFMLHVRMLDNDNQLQQDAIGILGVNMIYAAYYHRKDIDAFLLSLMDNLHGRIFIDMIRLEGPAFTEIDHRILCLKMVKFGLTDVAMFGPDARSLQAAEYLYKKNVLVVRSRFRPVTVMNWEMISQGFKQFVRDTKTEENRAAVLAEITLNDLESQGEIDLEDYLDRVALLGELNQVVVISNCTQHQKLINYLLDYKIALVGFVMSIWHLKDILFEKYERNKNGKLLAAFGSMFSSFVRIYAYPAFVEEDGSLLTVKDVQVPEDIADLYRFMLHNRLIVDFEDYNQENIKLYSREVLRSIKRNEQGWEKLVPQGTADFIKENQLFGYKPAE